MADVVRDLQIKVANLERELRVMLSGLIGSPLVCAYSTCQRRGLGGQEMGMPHLYIRGECWPKDDEGHAIARGRTSTCRRCGKVGEVRWWALPRAWWVETGDGVTWQASWLCVPCIRGAGQLILGEQLAAEPATPEPTPPVLSVVSRETRGIR